MENEERLSSVECEAKFDPEQLPYDLFEKRDVVVLGEKIHGGHTETILRFLEKFGTQLNQIFLEFPVDYQESIDKYFADGKVDEGLEGFFMGAEGEGNNIRGLLKIFDKIKEIGKTIICFDSSKTKEGEYSKKSKNGYYFFRGNSRDEDMFVNFQRYYEQMPGKYLLIVGNGHVDEGESIEGGEKLGTKLKDFLGDKYIKFEMQAEDPKPNFEQRELIIDRLIDDLAKREEMNQNDILSDIVTFAPYEGNEETSDAPYLEIVAEKIGISAEEMNLYAIKKAKDYLGE